jgi:hypothetical protein
VAREPVSIQSATGPLSAAPGRLDEAVVLGVAGIVDGLERGDGVTELVNLDLEGHRGRQGVRVAHEPDQASVRPSGSVTAFVVWQP